MTASLAQGAVEPAPRREERRALLTLGEWQKRRFPGVALSSADRVLVERLGESGEGRVEIDELRDGLQVSARSWVGVIRLESVEIRILPKLAGDRLDLVRLLELTSGIEGLWRPEGEATLDLADESLLDLVALLLAEATQGVIRRGLMAGYVEREEDLPMVRGRILGDRQILERFGRLDRIICRFDELEHDIDENRLLAAALGVASRMVAMPVIHRKLARLRAILEPICDPSKLDLKTARAEITYNRLNSHYRQAHALAWFILDALGVDDLLAPGPTRSFAFLLNMNLLFERFVRRLLERIFSPRDYRVDYQAAQSSIIWDADKGKPYARVIPDLVVQRRNGGRLRLALDAKYKLYDERPVDASDIYQTFLYAYALGSRSEGRTPLSLLLYPASSADSTKIHLKVRTLLTVTGAEIIGVGIPIPPALKELQSGAEGPVCAGLRGLIADALSM